ncbi:unnamed protein product, partial [Amoebophrya sp. A120]
ATISQEVVERLTESALFNDYEALTCGRLRHHFLAYCGMKGISLLGAELERIKERNGLMNCKEEA